MPDKLSISLQENLLSLVLFSVKSAPLIRNSISLPLYSSQLYREVVSRAYDYLDQYKVPAADHLPDLFEDELKGDNATQYGELFASLYEQKEKVNEEYVLSKLESFVRQQTLKSSIIGASEAIQEGDLDRAEEQLNKGLRTRLSLFSQGLSLADWVRLAYAHEVRKNVVPTGITELDKWNLGPARGELHLFIAAPKKGKTWWLISMAKWCLLSRLKVVYITLEISEAQIAQRMIQSMFSVMRHKAKVPVTNLVVDGLGRLMHFTKDTLIGRLSLDDRSSRPAVEKKLNRFRGRGNMIIKAFPTGGLTVPALTAYLDMLEQSSGFVPDMLIVDYPDLMRVDTKNYRIDLGAIYRDLRGVAVERNIGVLCASQSNRTGASAKLITDIHAGEDFSKIATADTVLTYTQTVFEREMGLARIFVSNSRVGDKDRFIVLISQAYLVGQFVLSSALMTDTYNGLLEQAAQQNGTNKNGGEDEEE